MNLIGRLDRSRQFRRWTPPITAPTPSGRPLTGRSSFLSRQGTQSFRDPRPEVTTLVLGTECRRGKLHNASVRAGTRPGDFRGPVTGTASIPESTCRRLTRAARQTTRRPVAAERARTHPQARAQRRRHVVKRRATVAAEFHSGGAGAQPVTSGHAFRIDALNSPARQILHAFPPCGSTRNPSGALHP
jgi:hypothetical protein